MWEPILQGRLLAEARAYVEQLLAHMIRRPIHAVFHPTLGRGDAGLTLLATYASLAYESETAAELVQLLLNSVIDNTPRVSGRFSLYGGITGIGWVIEHMCQVGGLSRDANAVLQSLDSALAKTLLEADWLGRFDLVHGLSGIGVYAIERLAGGQASSLLEQVTTLLSRTADASQGGAAWKTVSTMEMPLESQSEIIGSFDLGVAHGMPGSLSVLARAAELGIELGAQLLDDVCSWMFTTGRLGQAEGGLAARILASGCAAGTPANAWCYGDIGVAAVMASAAIRANRRELLERAVDIALRAINRLGQPNHITNPFLCHGTAGLCHLNNSLYQITKVSVFREMAVRCARHTLALSSKPLPSEHDTSRLGFLDGEAGIALVLLAASSDVPPRWDRLLGLSQ